MTDLDRLEQLEQLAADVASDWMFTDGLPTEPERSDREFIDTLLVAYPALAKVAKASHELSKRVETLAFAQFDVDQGADRFDKSLTDLVTALDALRDTP